VSDGYGQAAARSSKSSSRRGFELVATRSTAPRTRTCPPN
jgi:hypothetical protein